MRWASRSPRRSSARRSRRPARGVRRRARGRRAAGRHRPSCRTRRARTPGRPRTPNGQRATVPVGQTVSRWPTRSTRVCSPNRQRRCVRPSTITRSPDRPSSSRARSSATDAQDSQAAGSALGDSLITSASSASTISGRRWRSASTSSGDTCTRCILRGSAARDLRSFEPVSSASVVRANDAAGATRMEPSKAG